MKLGGLWTLRCGCPNRLTRDALWLLAAVALFALAACHKHVDTASSIETVATAAETEHASAQAEGDLQATETTTKTQDPTEVVTTTTTETFAPPLVPSAPPVLTKRTIAVRREERGKSTLVKDEHAAAQVATQAETGREASREEKTTAEASAHRDVAPAASCAVGGYLWALAIGGAVVLGWRIYTRVRP